jgi:hypothetical protein
MNSRAQEASRYRNPIKAVEPVRVAWKVRPGWPGVVSANAVDVSCETARFAGLSGAIDFMAAGICSWPGNDGDRQYG